MKAQEAAWLALWLFAAWRASKKKGAAEVGEVEVVDWTPDDDSRP